MGKLWARGSALLTLLAMLLAVALPSAAQAAKWYIDNALGEVKPEEKMVPAHPKPVQLLWEFQRDGSPNPKATKVTKPWAVDDLKALGAFTEIADTPAADGAVLSVKFNNVVNKEELDKSKKEGFRAGLGLGLFGGVVATDHYVITLEYIPATGAKPITTVVNHAIYMKFGKKDVQINGTEVKNLDEAAKGVIRQALARGINNIVSDPAFPR